MVFKRKIFQKLFDWKLESKKKCLLIKGPRQIGKTYCLKKFAEENYENVIYINFWKNPELKNIFNGSLDVDSLIILIERKVENSKFVAQKTILILDEIQSCQRAFSSLRFWYEDKRFDVVASGSLIGVSLDKESNMTDEDFENENKTIFNPVGSVEEVNMHSLDFEEFLWAIGVKENEFIKMKDYYSNVEKIPENWKEVWDNYTKLYIKIGGMPAVVEEYLNTKNFQSIYNIQRNLMDGYERDIIKYAPYSDKIKVIKILHSIPNQLLQEYKSFKYSLVEKNKKSRDYLNPLLWIVNSGILDICNNISELKSPLISFKKSDNFKIYYHDIGMLTASFQDKDIFEQIDSGTLPNNVAGAIYENLISSQIKHNNLNLYFFGDSQNYEVEFVSKWKQKVCLIEVKKKNSVAQSLKFLLEKNSNILGIKVIGGNIGNTNNILTIPHFLFFLLLNEFQ